MLILFDCLPHIRKVQVLFVVSEVASHGEFPFTWAKVRQKTKCVTQKVLCRFLKAAPRGLSRYFPFSELNFKVSNNARTKFDTCSASAIGIVWNPGLVLP